MGRWKVRRSQRSEPSSVPLLVVAAIVTTWHLFRTAMFFSVPQFCLPPHEFWVDAMPPNWPLLGSFVLVFLLLFVWTVCLIPAAGSLDRKLLIACAAGLMLIGYGFYSVVDAMGVIYRQETADDSSWNRTRKAPFEISVCEQSKPYRGLWRVVSVDVPFLGQEFPYSTVDLRRDGTMVVSYGRFRPPIQGFWSAPSHWTNVGSIWTEEVDGAWAFHLSANRLILSTPSDWEEPISTVVLERM